MGFQKGRGKRNPRPFCDSLHTFCSYRKYARGATSSRILQKTKKQTERAGTCPLFPLCAVLFQQIIVSRVQRVAYSAQLHGLYVLYAAPLFYGNIIEKIAPPGKAEPPVHRSQKYTKNFCKNAEKSA